MREGFLNQVMDDSAAMASLTPFTFHALTFFISRPTNSTWTRCVQVISGNGRQYQSGNHSREFSYLLMKSSLMKASRVAQTTKCHDWVAKRSNPTVLTYGYEDVDMFLPRYM